MQNFDIVKTITAPSSFRVESIIAQYDLQTKNIEERFSGKINLSNEWSIGLITGKSGTGKTTIAKKLFQKAYVKNFIYKEKTVIDDMPANKNIKEITSAFNSVGFSSPPSWLKPYKVLSNGQKMRADLARALLSDEPLIVFDEFTSVVDREVAKIGSYAIQKSVRKSDKKFIAVTCHNDVEDWLMPDWVFDCDSMEYRLGNKKKDQKLSSRYIEQKIRDYGKCLLNTTI